MSEEFVTKVTESVRRHPDLYYSIKIEDEHIPFLPARGDPLNDTFCNVWHEYSYAMFDSIRQLIRYEKSLYAWKQLVEDTDDNVKNTVVMDYVFPTFRIACDLPSTFKDQVIRAVVKLTCISEGDSSPIATSSTGESKRMDWVKKIKRICKKNPDTKKLYDAIDRDLYNSQDATHFRNLHGFAIHDSSSNLVSGKPVTAAMASGVVMFGYEEPLDLVQELEIIDRHRRSIQNVYVMFDEYASKLYENL